MGLESNFWTNTVKTHAHGKWIRVESPTNAGLPDCCALTGRNTSWVELKAVKTFVPGLGTSAIQRRWMHLWCEEGGFAYLFAKVGKEMLFMSGWNLPVSVGAEEWRARCLVYGATSREFDWDKLFQVMCSRN